MNEVECDQRLKQHRELAVPPSTAPSMESLQQKVGEVRRRRTMTRAAMGTAVVLICVIGSFSILGPAGRDQISPNNQDVAAIDETLDSGTPDVESLAVKTLAGKKPVIQALEKIPASQPRIQLYARVRGAVPIFGIDADNQSFQHVGWTESERKVPVDMRYVPANQQETFNAVLSGDSHDDWHLSL